MVDIQEYTEQLKTLVNIESGSYIPEGVDRVADELEKWFRGLGWHIDRRDVGKEAGNLLICTNHPAAAHYDAMFIGHMDTVFPAGSVAEHPFTIDPADPTKIYGLGTNDMKDGDVAMYQVAKHLSADALEKLDICMIFNPDEEIGSRYSREIVDEIADRSDCCFVMEGAGDNNCHCINRKGSLHYTLRFHGIAGHAGFMFENGAASAILELGHYIVKLMGLASREKDTTVNVGVVKGGTVTNVVPEYAELAMESRFWSLEERERVIRGVEALVNGEPHVAGVKVEIADFGATIPWPRTAENEAFFAEMKATADRLGIVCTEKGRGGLSDANHIGLHCPRCIDGMGPAGGGLTHNLGEWGSLAHVDDCVRLLVAMLEDVSAKK